MEIFAISKKHYIFEDIEGIIYMIKNANREEIIESINQ